jgi:hypothetical protein
VVEDQSHYEFPLCSAASHGVTGCGQEVQHGFGSALGFTSHQTLRETNEPVLKNIDALLSADAMRNKLLFYQEKFV